MYDNNKITWILLVFVTEAKNQYPESSFGDETMFKLVTGNPFETEFENYVLQSYKVPSYWQMSEKIFCRYFIVHDGAIVTYWCYNLLTTMKVG